MPSLIIDRLTAQQNQIPEADRSNVFDWHIQHGHLLDLSLLTIGKQPILHRDEAGKLADVIRAGNEARQELNCSPRLQPRPRKELRRAIYAREQALTTFAQANQGLVLSIAWKYNGRGVPIEDLAQQGNIGLMKAATKYDSDRGAFSTYARWWIRAKVTEGLLDQQRTIRIPRPELRTVEHIFHTMGDLRQKLDRDPTHDEIADALNLPTAEMDGGKARKRLVRRLNRITRTVSLDDDRDGNTRTLLEKIPSPLSESPTAVVENHELRQLIDQILLELPPRQARVLMLHMGLHDQAEHTFEAIGQMVGLNHETMRLDEVAAIKAIQKNPVWRRKLREFYRE